MSRYNEHIDEHILAAFLSGNLPAPLRKEIAAYIAQNERARDLLSMANEAMEVVDSGDGYQKSQKKVPSFKPPFPIQAGVEPSERDRKLWKLAAFFAGAVLFLAITVGLLAFEYRVNSLRPDALSWMPSVEPENLVLSWRSQPNATSYQVMAQNQETGETSLLNRTQSNFVQIEQSGFAFDLQQPYQIWILAVDAEDKVLSKSGSITLRDRD